jgi:hypothetical protein
MTKSPGSALGAKLVPGGGALFGAYVNQDDTWQGEEDAFAKVEAFEALIGRPLAIDMHFYDWTDAFPSGLEQWDVANGRIPLITWRGANLAAIGTGRYDELIRERAVAVKRLGAPVFLRWGWEMNTNLFAHAGPLNMPNGPAKFVAAWRRIHRIFDAAGAANVVWVWCPNAESLPHAPWNAAARYYPGDEFVDWVGVDGYNWGTTQRWSRWQTFADIVRPTYDAYAARKPIMVAETASAETGGDKAAWIRSLQSGLARDFPAVKALVWFEVSKETDWRAESSDASLAAFRSLAQSSYFARGEQPVPPADPPPASSTR